MKSKLSSFQSSSAHISFFLCHFHTLHFLRLFLRSVRLRQLVFNGICDITFDCFTLTV